MYDVTDVKTFQHIAYWLRNIQQYASPSVARILVANKIDKPNRQVTMEMGQAFAQQMGIPYYECTAKDGEKVEAAFRGIADVIVETLANEATEQANHQNNQNNTVQLTGETGDKKNCAC